MIETERLLLRPPKLEDFERWADMMQDEPTARYIGGLQEKPVAWRAMMSVAGAWALTGISMFCVLEKDTGRWLGRVGPWCPYGWPGTEVGWALHPDAQGKGYALEAARASMSFAFETLGWTDIIHTIHPDNTASQRLAARLGSTNRGPVTLPAPYADNIAEVWGQTREEWRARQ